MQNFFTFSRVDRHEISFRVEQNPEKKTATDVARAINDSRFKNNLQRRYGVVLVRAGVGDKVRKSRLFEREHLLNCIVIFRLKNR